MGDLEGKIAIVTGAGGKRGIGRATALCLAQKGADVVVSDISLSGIRYTEDDRIEGWQGLKDVEVEIRALGRKAIAVEADISSGQQVEEMVARCIAEFGRIDILVNNAGISGPRNVPALDVPEKDWHQIIAVNIMGTYLCVRAVAKRMIEQGQGGKIINIASMYGKFYPGRGHGPYAVSKFGVIGLTQVLARELASYRINVNAVCPNTIATDISAGANIRGYMRSGMSLDEATAKSYANTLPQIPLGRAGQPEDVAKIVTFLASSDSDYMTGQAINVTGGFLMCH